MKYHKLCTVISAVKMYIQGYSVSEISKQSKIPRSTIYNYLKDSRHASGISETLKAQRRYYAKNHT